MPEWIDFRELRTKLDFARVLRHFNVEVKCKGRQHHGYCPLPNHNGKRNSPSFSANLEKGIFQCFGCKAKGNVLDFAALMQGINPQDGTALRKVAGELAKQFCIGEEKQLPKKPEPTQAKLTLPVAVNAPLNFELKRLDPKHPYLLGRGFTAETIERFGLGFCSKGMLKDRVAIPLHDDKGTLIGYAGRVVDDSLITEDNPRYRLPGDRERDGMMYEFQKTLFLYNGHRIKAPVDDLIVVESFTSTWWLSQNDILYVVATMGSDCSERQAELIASLVKPDGGVWVLTDGDPAGEHHGASVTRVVSPHRFIRWVKLEKDKQPTDYIATQLREKLR